MYPVERCAVYQKTLMYNIYPRIMTKVNVSPTVGMSATVEEIEYALRNVRLEIIIHKSAHITSEDRWNNMSKAHKHLNKIDFRSESISWDLTIFISTWSL